VEMVAVVNQREAAKRSGLFAFVGSYHGSASLKSRFSWPWSINLGFIRVSMDI